jgi:hypothetical protein
MSSLNFPIQPLTAGGHTFGAPAAPGSPNVRDRIAIVDACIPSKVRPSPISVVGVGRTPSN